MPAWWGRKSKTSSRKKEEQQEHKHSIIKSTTERPKSFDESLIHHSNNNNNNNNNNFILFKNKDLSPSGFDSDGVLEKKGHPLPLPSAVSFHDHGSVSSVSSSGSSDDPTPDLAHMAHYRYSNPTNTPRGRSLKPDSHRQQHIVENRTHSSSSPIPEHSRVPDISFSPRSEYHGSSTPTGSALCSPRASIEIEFNPRSRSPGPGLRGHAFPTSPLHGRANGFSPGSSMEKNEDGRTECHPLPLPPGSPNSLTPIPPGSPNSHTSIPPGSPNSHTSGNNGTNESMPCLRSRWKKGRLLGRGTFGHVYAGFNSESGQMGAIKEVRVISDDQNSKESLRQLNQEITLLSQLSHPNIVQYYGSELAEDTLSVYLEIVSGGSIHKLLQDYGPLKESVIQNYTAQILSGLAYLHERDTVHRDIKGANILVDSNGEIKLADFGMAKHITSCTSVLSFKGSPYWMAPEVIMNFNGYNLAVDIWSLGCTILEMATSKPPWSQYEGVAAIFKIGNSKDIPEIPDHISDDGKNFLKLCLQRDPSARPTAAQLLEHPFVRDQATVRVARFTVNRDLLQTSADDIHALNTNRKNIPSPSHGDYGTRLASGLPTTFRSDQAGTRMNLSLPVSPCSSPLRQFGPAHRSCFLSPPPAYMMGMGGGNDVFNHSVFPSRTYTNVTTDIFAERAQSQTPNASPRGGHVRSL
ncbi:hypothetical protein MRB53_015026 [Persea americana]|uniref:Uncharacterized protein n=1 Tax=Persea americana TaxID=3435 RepID=A0ACC2KCH6_PERAE|nr:hypothetical protein MRB53_015026 [Persea americana]|eukprot:TRINITY_DN1426_c0_g1_i2.p1 TRINITY_DN1426_c0_g1~~TRINITY_DN1426_c0_g1_i2.p1  ORF type:complete len:725 (-),score=137.02 TRINITY_DN1426_c0_g1_i2:763-2838(-)